MNPNTPQKSEQSLRNYSDLLINSEPVTPRRSVADNQTSKQIGYIDSIPSFRLSEIKMDQINQLITVIENPSIECINLLIENKIIHQMINILDYQDVIIQKKALLIITSIIRTGLLGLEDGNQNPYYKQFEFDGTIDKLIEIFTNQCKWNIHYQIAQILAQIYKSLPLPIEIRSKVIQCLKNYEDIDNISLLAQNQENHDAILENSFEKFILKNENKIFEYLHLIKFLLSIGSNQTKQKICEALREKVHRLTFDDYANQLDQRMMWDNDQLEEVKTRTTEINSMIESIDNQINERIKDKQEKDDVKVNNIEVEEKENIKENDSISQSSQEKLQKYNNNNNQNLNNKQQELSNEHQQIIWQQAIIQSEEIIKQEKQQIKEKRKETDTLKQKTKKKEKSKDREKEKDKDIEKEKDKDIKKDKSKDKEQEKEYEKGQEKDIVKVLEKEKLKKKGKEKEKEKEQMKENDSKIKKEKNIMEKEKEKKKKKEKKNIHHNALNSDSTLDVSMKHIPKSYPDNIQPIKSIDQYLSRLDQLKIQFNQYNKSRFKTVISYEHLNEMKDMLVQSKKCKRSEDIKMLQLRVCSILNTLLIDNRECVNVVIETGIIDEVLSIINMIPLSQVLIVHLSPLHEFFEICSSQQKLLFVDKGIIHTMRYLLDSHDELCVKIAVGIIERIIHASQEQSRQGVQIDIKKIIASGGTLDKLVAVLSNDEYQDQEINQNASLAIGQVFKASPIPKEFRNKVILTIKKMTNNEDVYIRSVSIDVLSGLAECQDNHSDILSCNYPATIVRFISQKNNIIVHYTLQLIHNILTHGLPQTVGMSILLFPSRPFEELSKHSDPFIAENAKAIISILKK